MPSFFERLRLRMQGEQPAEPPAYTQGGARYAAAETRLDAAPLELAFVGPDGLDLQYAIITAGLNIGRDPGNNVHLTDGLVSRFHARIWYDGSRYWLRDENSLNGTLLNGRPIAGTKELSRHDSIEIGNTLFYLLAPTDPMPSGTTGERVSWATGDWVDDYNAGYHLGQYKLLREIGATEMSTVWEATTRGIDGRVAVKIINPDLLSDPEYTKRFWAEADVGLSLDHPNIIQVHRFENTFTPPFIVMEYIDNVLPNMMHRSRYLTADQTISIVAQICEALSYVHNSDIVHRDIKPGNIFVQRDGLTKLGDFGIAKVMTRSLTRQGTIWGTYKYMSPEQVKGEDLDWRTDIYSLGIAMYEFLTGRPPFYHEDPLQVGHMHVFDRPRYPLELNPSTPPHLADVAMRALEKDRRHRFQTAAEMREALGSHHPHPQPDPPGPQPVRRAFLRVENGSQQGEIISLTPSGQTLNRSDIDPQDMAISRRQARIYWQDNQYWLEDMDSINGTYVDGREVRQATPLQPGSQIRVGETDVYFECR